MSSRLAALPAMPQVGRSASTVWQGGNPTSMAGKLDSSGTRPSSPRCWGYRKAHHLAMACPMSVDLTFAGFPFGWIYWGGRVRRPGTVSADVQLAVATSPLYATSANDRSGGEHNTVFVVGTCGAVSGLKADMETAPWGCCNPSPEVAEIYYPV